LKMRTSIRFVLAAATFAAVAWLPDLVGAGAASGSSDLGLADLLGKGSILAFGVAFAGGVATSLTPCVYPLIPITVSLFGARRAGSRAEAVALSALYVLGIAITYSALGVGAAATGKAFGSVMQNPWAIGLVAAVLAAMAASMFGAFELQLPSSWQARLNTVGGAGRAGALGMGLVSGLIAAPCTGPVLTAALAFVAAKGSIAFGVGIMFTYALGMGLLFFLIGAFSISLPKSGAWMDTVKSIFGVALLAAALAFLKDAFPVMKPLFSAARWAAFVAAGAAAVGVLAGALSGSFHGPAAQRLAKGAGVALLVGGIVYGLGAAGARHDSAVRARSFEWLHSYDDAVALARAQGRPMIIDFWADWCVACKELDATAWSDPAVKREGSRFVAVKLDGTDSSDAFVRLAERYGVFGMPTVIFLDGRGREVPDRVVGAIDAPEMLTRLQGVDGACEKLAALPDPAPADRPSSGAMPVACAARW
jgi:thioredoxin:protein disulfide reductase